MKSSNEIRSEFLKFFKSKGHKILPSSSLVPSDDPTLLFTNAGMNQFKDIFLGAEKTNYHTASTSQRCVRAGGKHNDLENVGYTARHHTFFEMLGNFSFGDYFKKEAISYAWELLTSIYQIPEEKLIVTVYAEDEDAYQIWHKIIGLAENKIIRIGDNKGEKYASDNFWMMGDTGPCGPCSEIFYDHGPAIAGGPPGSKNEDGDRFIEIWNLVFMQYNRDEKGIMHDLPKPSVDTGMGLERIAAVLQGVHQNYDIDLFKTLIDSAAKITNAKDVNHPSLKVIADHIRATTFLIHDGILPSNEGRGYVLRRILRRAIRHGYKLGMRKAFFHQLVEVTAEVMGDACSISQDKISMIEEEILNEENRFFETIDNGMTILNDSLNSVITTKQKILSGKVAFKLHDTFGFPLDLTADICREHSIDVNHEEFESEMAKQKTRARSSGKFKALETFAFSGPDTIFVGYEATETESTIIGLYVNNESVNKMDEGVKGLIILDQTPFYAESGGQIGDSGHISNKNFVFEVTTTLKVNKTIFVHEGIVKKGNVKINDHAQASIDVFRREAIKRNHSATHLLHKALKMVLGEHVEQKGSLVTEDRTRFDFSHPKGLTDIEKSEVEKIVNNEILKNQATQTRMMAIKEAQKEGAMMLFGEKYDENVRVLDIGNSRELCGGTHVSQTGDIGLFKIQTESGVASGIRRIEATSGLNVINLLHHQQTLLENVAKELNTSANDVMDKLRQLLTQFKENEKAISTLKTKLMNNQGEDLTSSAIKIKDFNFLAAQVENTGPNELREMIDKIKTKLKTAVIILATHDNSKISLAVGITDDLTDRFKAGAIAKIMGEQLGGKGGGRDNMAMAGGSKISSLDLVLSDIKNYLNQ